MNQITETFSSGRTTVHVVETEGAMGEVTAWKVAGQIERALERGHRPVLWLMAAPSAFAFYRAFVKRCREDARLAEVVRTIPIYQFDDYPIERSDPRYPVTFRALLENHLFAPLAEACGPLGGIRPMELTGTAADAAVAAEYAAEITTLLDDPSTWVIQVKGIGMDGHWGFHGAETPLDAQPGIIRVPLGSQNRRQQRIDWPDLFPRDEDVPRVAYTATVSLFLKADYIIDNVPQSSKQFSVLACYGTEAVSAAVPSSALKRHANAEAVLTRTAAGELLAFRHAAGGGVRTLSAEALARLDALWSDPDNPESAQENRRLMRAVLEEIGLISR